MLWWKEKTLILPKKRITSFKSLTNPQMTRVKYEIDSSLPRYLLAGGVQYKAMQPFIYPSLPMHFSPLFISSLVTLSQIHSAVWKQNFFWFTSFFCRLPWKSIDKPARLTILPICQIRYKDRISGTVTLSKQVCLMVTEKNGKWSRLDGWAENHCLYTTTFRKSFCKI